MLYVKTWAQVLEENRARLQFFQEKLEYQADKEASAQHLKDHYAEFIQGVITLEGDDGQDDTESNEEADLEQPE